jgi:hypothetical protein
VAPGTTARPSCSGRPGASRSPLRGNAAGSLLRDLDALVLRRATSTRDVVRARDLLADVKVEMGQAAIREALAHDLAATDVISPLAAAPQRWKVSHVDLTSDRGTAHGFTAWYARMVARNHLRDGLVACPDHYRIVTDPDGRQDVIEVTGGAFVASEFRVDYHDPAHVSVPPDQHYPYRTSGSATAPNGKVIGSVQHMTRNTGHGFAGSFNVAFPATLPPWFISEHRWHLACEFSNWITAYVREAGR